VKNKVPRLSREHPRYERANVRPSVRQVLHQVAAVVDVEVSALLKKGRRGEANHVRKVAMYLVKRLCVLTLQETAVHFGVKSYGVVGWAYAQVRAKQTADQRFKKGVDQVEAEMSQQKICSPFLDPLSEKSSQAYMTCFE
jgi:chromosomal replication initiation ATPase DnaA